MGLSLRTGRYGSYYGNDFNSSVALSQTQMEVNATYIYSYLTDKGWSVNAIAGILGNMQHESALNPGRWEGNNVGSGPGYGLTQWTPFSKYTDWCSSKGYSDPSEMDNNLARIIWELENNEQYYATSGYPESFSTFSKSDKSPYYLACAFAWNYERSAVVIWGANSKAEADTLTEAQKEANREALRQKRGSSAENWYKYITGETPTPPDPDTPGGDEPGFTPTLKNKKYKFVLFRNRKRFF